MNRRLCLLSALAGLFCAASPAWAEEPYYFHKSGVTRAAYVEDVNYCAGLSGGVRGPDYRSSFYSSNMTATAIGNVMGAFFTTLMERSARRRLVSRVERTCMGDKGYERRSIDRASHRAIIELEGEARIDRMFALVAAEQPLGKVLVE